MAVDELTTSLPPVPTDTSATSSASLTARRKEGSDRTEQKAAPGVESLVLFLLMTSRSYSNMPAATYSASAQVFDTAELLEMILLETDDIKTVLLSQRVSKNFKAAVKGSSKLKQKLWFKTEPIESRLGWATVNTLLDPPYRKGRIIESGEDLTPLTHARLGHGYHISIGFIITKMFDGQIQGSWRDMLVAQTPDGYFHCNIEVASPVSWSGWTRNAVSDQRWYFSFRCKRDTTIRQLVEMVKMADWDAALCMSSGA